MLNYTCNASTYLLMFQLTTICAKSVISSHNNHKITDKQCNPYFHFQLYFSTLKVYTHQKPPRCFCILFFEVLPFTTLGKTSKKSVQKRRGGFRCVKTFMQKTTTTTIEPRYEKTGFLHMRKQRRRSASR